MNNAPKTLSVIAVVLIVGLAVAGYFVMYTFLPNYNTAKSSLVLAQANNASLKKALDSVQTFLTNYKAQTVSPQRVKLALPAGSPDMPNFISSLSDVATSSGVALSDFKISDSTGAVSASQYTIERQDFGVTASGSYASMKYFLNRVESHLRLIDIYDMTVAAATQSDQKNSEAILQFNLKIHTYFQQ